MALKIPVDTLIEHLDKHYAMLFRVFPIDNRSAVHLQLQPHIIGDIQRTDLTQQMQYVKFVRTTEEVYQLKRKIRRLSRGKPKFKYDVNEFRPGSGFAKTLAEYLPGEAFMKVVESIPHTE